MTLYAIFRRDGFHPNEIEAADRRSNAELERRAEHVRKIRTYLLDEPGGRLGAICLYEATDPDAVREHARAAQLPCDEVIRVVAIDVKRPDPSLTPS
ncbi:MAG TPA: nickel-binding protein [Microlunatus sp.]